MAYRISALSEYAKRILISEKGKKNMTVHSVYRRTINFSDGIHLLALQAAETPLSPVSLITSLSSDEMEALGVQRGGQVQIRDDRITVEAGSGIHTFSFGRASAADLSLSSSLPPRELSALGERIANVLSRADTGGFRDIFSAEKSGSLILDAAGRQISRCLSLYGEKKYEAAAGELTRLIGLGGGLTPSGDDFLCGTLAGLTLCGQKDSAFTVLLRRRIAAGLSDTNDISRTFLRCALDGQFSLPVISLRRIPSEKEIDHAFRAVGHSSGMDTLCGLGFAISFPLPAAFPDMQEHPV